MQMFLPAYHIKGPCHPDVQRVHLLLLFGGHPIFPPLAAVFGSLRVLREHFGGSEDRRAA